MNRIVLETQRRQLGEEVLGQTGVDAEPQAGGWPVEHDQLVELVADAFGRHDLQAFSAGHDGFDQGRIRFESEAGDESGGAQHAQRIVAEADLRRERSAQDTLGQVGCPTVGVDERRMARPGSGRASDRQGDRVDREVAATEIVLDAVRERHPRLA